jgi:hypothetical protein
VTSENAVERQAQGPGSTSENTNGTPRVAFSAAASAAGAPQKTRLPKTTISAGLLDPFRVPQLLVDSDPQRSGRVDGEDG